MLFVGEPALSAAVDSLIDALSVSKKPIKHGPMCPVSFVHQSSGDKPVRMDAWNLLPSHMMASLCLSGRALFVLPLTFSPSRPNLDPSSPPPWIPLLARRFPNSPIVLVALLEDGTDRGDFMEHNKQVLDIMKLQYPQLASIHVVPTDHREVK